MVATELASDEPHEASLPALSFLVSIVLALLLPLNVRDKVVGVVKPKLFGDNGSCCCAWSSAPFHFLAQLMIALLIIIIALLLCHEQCILHLMK